MGDNPDEQTERFFTKSAKKRDSGGSVQGVGQDDTASLGGKGSDEVEEQGQCLTLRLLQRMMPCLEKKSIWEPSQGDVYKSHEVEETKYPMILKILESKIVDVIFVFTCLMSGFLFFFSEGFLLRNHILSGIIHSVNALYTLGLFGQWLRILVESKYSKTNQGYTKSEVVFSLLSIFPSDLIVLAIYSINDRPLESTEDKVFITFSRLNYLIRLFYAQKHLSAWENQLVLGDFTMFLIRLSIYVLFFIHAAGCLWHRAACSSFSSRHFKMTPQEAATDVCTEHSWAIILLQTSTQFSNIGDDGNVLLNHYIASVYWVLNTALRYGDGDIEIHLTSIGEVIFTAFTQIFAWIFTLAYVLGTLTSLLIERDTQRENFQNRKYAINKFMDFSYTSKAIVHDVRNFYDFLWERRKGILQLDLIDEMPPVMKAEVFYEINKFVINQLPILAKMDNSVIMKLAGFMRHSFHLQGEILFKKHQTGQCLYYVLKGFLEVLNDDETLPITNIKSGSAIGEIYLMHPYPHAATVRCGTQCDIMVLNRQNFRQVIAMYPELWDTLNQRVANRLNQSDILLSLAEKKYNNYISAFGKIKVNIRSVQEQHVTKHQLPRSENMGEVLLNEDQKKKIKIPDESDGVNVSAFRRLSVIIAADDAEEKEAKKNERQRRRRSLETEAFAALETDINGAAKLAKDLGILIPPLVVSTPSNYFKGVSGSTHDRKQFIRLLIHKKRERSLWHFSWKIMTTLCIFLNIWFCTFMFAFRTPQYVPWGYAAHLLDLFVLVDFCLDACEPVVTPQKVLESIKEILFYKLRTSVFYWRIFGFFPWEYIIAEIVGWNWESGNVVNWFYFTKFNRALELIVVSEFFCEIESSWPTHILSIFMAKFVISIIFFIHAIAVCLEAVIRDVLDQGMHGYLTPFYWSTQIVTTTGFGDFTMSEDPEVIILAAGLIIGTCVITYCGAKISALAAHLAKRRLSFKHMFFSLKRFMKKRHFPHELEQRISAYYKMQWLAHQGALTPTQNSVIWDAPESMVETVAIAQALHFVARIPLVQFTSLDLQAKLCMALRRYFVPPGEVILYPGDFRRELYIIVKGSCEVFAKDKTLIGSLTEGNFFGLPGLVDGVNRNYQIVTKTHCQFFCLLFEDFLILAKKYKSLGLDFRVLRGITNVRKRKSTFTANIDPGKLGLLEAKPDIIAPTPSLLIAPSIQSTAEIIAKTNSATAKSLGGSHTGSKSAFPLEPEGSLMKIKSADLSGIAAPGSNVDVIGSSILPTSAVIKPISSMSMPSNTKLCHRCRCVLLNFTFKPTEPFMKYWTVVRTCSAFLVTIFALAQACFAFHPTASFFIMLILDLIAYIDLYLMFHLAYFDADNQLVSKATRTARNYLRKSFGLDLIACFPFEVLIFIASPRSVAVMLAPAGVQYGGDFGLYLISFCRLNRILQIYRLFTATKFLNSCIFPSLTLATLVEIVPMLFVFTSTLACLSYVSFCYWEKGTDPMTCVPHSWITTFRPLNQSTPAWLEEPNYGFTPFSSYVIAIYWTAQSAYRVGFGDFQILDDPNLTMAVIVVLLGTFVTLYLGGKLTAANVGKDSKRIALREEMEVLFEFMAQYNVSQGLQRRARELYIHNWEISGGTSHEDFFVAMHPNLTAEAGTYMYEESLLKCPLLKDLDKAGVRFLATRLIEKYYPEGEYIMKSGDLNDDFFLISKGIIVSYKENGEIISYMGPGSLIGEISAILEVRRIFSAVASTAVELFLFRRIDFLEFLHIYPELGIRLEFACLNHYRESLVITRAPSLPIERMSLEPVAPGEEDEAKLTYRSTINAAEKGEARSHHAHAHLSPEPVEIIPDRDVSPGGSGTSVNDEYEERVPADESVMGSYVNLTEAQAAKHPEFIMDPLRVTMKARKPPSALSVSITQKTDSGLPKRPWWSIFLTFGRIPRNQMGLLHIYQARNETTFLKWTVHPASPLCSASIFVCLYLLITCISCSLSIFEIAFRVDNHSERNYVVALRYIVEFFFVIRFIGNFGLGYYDENGLLVFKSSLIIRRYAIRFDGLALDVLTTFPINFYEFVPANVQNSVDTLHSVGAILLLLKLLRVILFVRYLRETESDLRIKVSQIKIAKISIILVFIFHFSACIWYMMACYGVSCSHGSWVNRTIAKFINEEPRIVLAPENVTISSRYFLSLFYVTTVITFTGLDNIEPANLQEIIMTIIFIFGTVFVIGYFVGEMAQCLASQIASKIHYQHEMTVMEEHFATLGLTKPKILDLRKYYKTLWQKSRGMSHFDLLQRLPYPLRADIAFEIYGPSLKGCRILSKVDDVISREICARIRHEVYLPGSHIVRAGEICDSMYIIKKGEVVILDENQNLELCVEILYENECFGEVKLILPREPYHFSYIARLESEVGVLPREDYEEIFSNYPTLSADLVYRANKLKKHRTRQKDEEAGVLDIRLETEDQDDDDVFPSENELAQPIETFDTEASLRLSVQGGPAARRLRAFSQSVRRNIDERASELAKRGSGTSHSSQIH